MSLSLSPNNQRVPHLLSDGSVNAESATSKANLLNSHFASCFTASSPVALPVKTPHTDPNCGLCNISCSHDYVYKMLIYIKIKTASSPDGIFSYMLRNTASSISTLLTALFNKYLSVGVVPSDWKSSPVFKGGNASLGTNYRQYIPAVPDI